MTAANQLFHMHHDPAEMVGRRERLGVRLLIVADGAFVFGMIFSYLYLRNLDSNHGWRPMGVQPLSASTSWMLALPFIVVMALHAFGTQNPATRRTQTVLAFAVLAIGAYAQLVTLNGAPLTDAESGGFAGAYLSTWALLGGANLFHYLLSGFIALGLMIRTMRGHVDPELEVWRMRTAQSWFTWAAISASACALTLMLG
jgi:ABC-type branched-subunit amino acid transport system permease subunit